ncbi:hypothetical protein [Neobacillus vireti]|uniref:hypothetical protein n=1 Tax=Neobacillus vireti TaxID=220686 RepID=UPI0030008454
MKVHTRLVINAEPEVKEMVNQIKHVTKKSIKEIVDTLIRQQFQRIRINWTGR